MFCSEELEITCNFTTFNTIAQSKNSRQWKQHIFLTHHVEVEYISYPSRRSWNHLGGAQSLNSKILAEFKSFVMNNEAFGNLFCNLQKSFHTSPGSFFKLNNGICIYKKS